MPAVVARNERCPLCGTEFDAEGQGCRPSCPMAKGCRVICCPSCGYSFPQEAGVAGGLRRLFDRLKEKRGHAP
ncbi:hypothetical protein [Anaeromyxobacter dehalogenans]|uniref:hypothetical protein n=1 Tax=Anaeromyxobacter dehalogenans TaxID=161493 RepID=UPI000306DE06|nr:hypothetical protein [Anaeromyxobacter dehalogenans]